MSIKEAVAHLSQRSSKLNGSLFFIPSSKPQPPHQQGFLKANYNGGMKKSNWQPLGPWAHALLLAFIYCIPLPACLAAAMQTTKSYEQQRHEDNDDKPSTSRKKKKSFPRNKKNEVLFKNIDCSVSFEAQAPIILLSCSFCQTKSGQPFVSSERKAFYHFCIDSLACLLTLTDRVFFCFKPSFRLVVSQAHFWGSWWPSSHHQNLKGEWSFVGGIHG